MPPSVSSRLAAANINRSTQRQNLEVPPESPGIIRGAVSAVGEAGVTLTTESGGTITIPRSNKDAQGVTPDVGSTYQVSVNGGQARLNIASRSQAQVTERVGQGQLIVADRAPTIDDKGNVKRPWWIDITPAPADGLFTADVYVWTGAVEGYAKVSGGGGTTIIYSTDPPPFPTTGNPSNGDGWHDTTVDRLWTYDATADLYRPAGSKSFYGYPGTTNSDTFVDGDRLFIGIGSDLSEKCEYIWEDGASDWVLITCCTNNCPADPPEIVCEAPSYYDRESPTPNANIICCAG